MFNLSEAIKEQKRTPRDSREIGAPNVMNLFVKNLLMFECAKYARSNLILLRTFLCAYCTTSVYTCEDHNNCRQFTRELYMSLFSLILFLLTCSNIL